MSSSIQGNLIVMGWNSFSLFVEFPISETFFFLFNYVIFFVFISFPCDHLRTFLPCLFCFSLLSLSALPSISSYISIHLVMLCYCF